MKVEREKKTKKKKERQKGMERRRARELDRQDHDDSIAITVPMGSIRVPATRSRRDWWRQRGKNKLN